MIFVKRQIEALIAAGVDGHIFWLASRTSIAMILSELRRLRREIARLKPDVMHAQYGTITAAIAVIASRRPVVVTFRGSDLNPAPEKGWVRCTIGRLVSQVAAFRAAHVICVSRALASRLWVRSGKVSVIPSGIDTRMFRPQCRELARNITGWGAEELVVLFNGGGRKVKRPDLARAAVATAKAECGPIRLVEMDGQTDPDKVPTLMNAADCLLLTSDYEGSPNVVKEAIACGLPVVTRDVGDVRELLCRVNPSFITDKSSQGIAAGLLAALSNPCRSNGPSSVKAFCTHEVTRRICAVYAECVGSRNRTSGHRGNPSD